MTGLVRAGAIVLQGGEPRVSSHSVAEHFGKNHKNVLRAIDRLRIDAADMMRDGDVTAARFHALNFEPMFSLVQIGNGATREDRAFSITEGGFMVLTMGFTGRESLRLKILFIEEFKRMREALQGQERAKRGGPAADRLLEPGNDHPEWLALLVLWRESHGSARIVSSQVRALAEGAGLMASTFARADSDRGRATVFGHALNARLDRDLGGFRIVRAPLRNGFPTYRLLPSEGL